MAWTIVLTAAITVLAVVLAMNFSTPEKKIERKIEHRHAIADPQFRREMSVLLGPAILPGNHVIDYENGDEIFPAMLGAIASAQKTITFETYIYWSGDIGKKFEQALSERARAGVKVHLLVDWVGSIKMDEDMLQSMKDAGVEVERYRPLHWYNLGRMNNRTHRKLLVIDGHVGYTGGVGIADQWTGHAQDPDHWREAHFRIEGPAVAQMQSAFNDNWIKTTGTLLNGPDYFPPLEPVGDMDAHLFIASPAGGSESMHLMYLSAIAAAEHTIDLTASYFVPDELIMKALVAARKRGVRVRVLLPGEHIDSETVRLSSKASWGGLLQAGIEIHEYQPTMLHVKLLIVDGELVSLGSTNFDIRSFRLNDEASLNVYDHGFAARMTEVFEKDLESAVQYSYEMWDNRPLREKLAEKFVRPFRSQL
ncbi:MULTISPECIES: phospholipase D-like domain-containing protein [unclassified Luteimonas]|uniref:phospholipase D-like domain-containing protein n=1 Tax=unclassified Luteimonas TaxID=2629088 RepID=UPI0018F0F7AA|nr:MULTISPECIES: phospholipase D-like domain-containing protein [unclassified Luteimonas]MBJ6978147.1 cardiolipin synthase B [Luteimonas sp. MC1895]MBJ6984147.1 cardiolipin synthase B [Luteimonas sp. MC1750]QQO07227.1 cardiolipin synthase B [Luteimonas sp. MC1750]